MKYVQHDERRKSVRVESTEKYVQYGAYVESTYRSRLSVRLAVHFLLLLPVACSRTLHVRMCICILSAHRCFQDASIITIMRSALAMRK
jgi:hypothetical protein